MSDLIAQNAQLEDTSQGIRRRALLKGVAAIAATSLLGGRTLPALAADDEDRWAGIAAEYPRSSKLMNLNNASVSPQPKAVVESMFEAYRHANEIPDVNMWESLDGKRPRIKDKLAALLDCNPQEIALNRNATEGLCTAIYGIELKAGDEVVICDWDYDAMRYAWVQRSRRDGVQVRKAQFSLMDDDEVIVEAYRRALTPRTKVMHITHVVHYSGRALPVVELCALARSRGIQTIVDAAQSFAQLPLSFRGIGCDYLAASLHKWLCAPFGTGVLLVRQSRIDPLWPLLASWADGPQGIDRFDAASQATYSSAAETAIEAAIDFHNAIGTDAKHARLQHLTRYWTERARDIPGFRMLTPVAHPQTTALSLFSIEGLKPETIEKVLREKHGIHPKSRARAGLTGVRVSPSIYTSTADLDKFVAALRTVASSV